MAAEDQEQAADQEQQTQQRFSTVEAGVVADAEDPGGEEADPDERGGDDAEDGAQHLEDAEAAGDHQPDAQVLARRFGGGHEVPALVGVLLGDHGPGDQVGEDPPARQAAEDDGDTDQRGVEVRGGGQPPAHTAELPFVARPQDLERGRPTAATAAGGIGAGRRGRLVGVPGPFAGWLLAGTFGGRVVGGRLLDVGLFAGRLTGRRRLIGCFGFHAVIIGLPERPEYRG
jgi:hypothetical protein